MITDLERLPAFLELLKRLIARMFRKIPYFKGKTRLVHYLNTVLHDFKKHENIVLIKMKQGYSMRIDLRSKHENQAYWLGEYDDVVISKLAAFLRPDDIFIDVGANVGFYSIPMAHRVKKIYAFEPLQSNFLRLNENIAVNGLSDKVFPFNFACGNAEGFVQLQGQVENSPDTSNAVIVGCVIENGKPGMSRMSKLDTLAYELNINSCGLLKIDVEGYELDVLKGGLKFIAKNQPLIYMELNSFWMKENRWSFEDLMQLMTPFKYRPFCLVNSHWALAKDGPSQCGIDNMLLVTERSINP